MGHGIDKNVKGIEKARGKMVRLMKETSNCCLILSIVIETALMVLILVYL
jgi:hypothetical protein